jgi:hypothetical protein
MGHVWGILQRYFKIARVFVKMCGLDSSDSGEYVKEGSGNVGLRLILSTPK